MTNTYMTRTVQVELSIDEATLARLKATLDMYTEIYNEHAQWATNNRSTSTNKVHDELYEGLREKYVTLPSAMIQCARNHAFGAVKSYNSNNANKKWSKTPVYRARSMRYDRRTVALNTQGTLTFSLAGGNRGKTSVDLPKYFTDRYGDWQFNSASIGVNRVGKAFANLSFRKIAPTRRANGRVVGIDRGIYNIATTSDNEVFSSKKVRGRKRQLVHNRASLQAKVASGSRPAKRRLRAQSEKEARFSKNELDIITKKLASVTDVQTYVLEDLTGLYTQRRSKNFNRLKNTWAPALFQFLLEYKCEENGIEVVTVDPRYTSQKCSLCGHVDRKNRSASRFVCRMCSFTAHADINAANNIRDKYISTLPAQP